MNELVEVRLALHVEALRHRIRAKGWSVPELERHLGNEPGALEARLENPRDLGFDDVLAVLEAIGVEPVDYFCAVANEIEEREGKRADGAGCLLPGVFDRELADAARQAVRNLLDRVRDWED